MFKKTLFTIASASFLLSSTLQGYFEGVWINSEYLYWKIQDSPKIVPLVVQGPVVPDGTPVLGLPNYETVLGGKKLNNNWRSGAKFSLGSWLDNECCLGVEASYFFLSRDSHTKSVSSNGLLGSAFLTIPFFDVTTDLESSAAVAIPTNFAGRADLKVSNYMRGVELNLFTTISTSCDRRIGLLGGLRFWKFVESLTLDTDSPYVPPNPTDLFLTHDRFQVKNNFFGGQLGANIDYFWNQISFNLTGKIALGAICQTADIQGYLVTNDFNGFGASQTFLGGFLALPTNIGHHEKTRFSIMPEININTSYKITDCLQLKLGYMFLYASNVLWASKQVDRNINPTQSAAIEFIPNPVLVGEASPKPSMKTAGLWTQGFNIGLEYQF